MRSKSGISLDEFEPRQPYLLVHPHELEEYRREFPGIVVRTFERVPYETDALNHQPRNRHERRAEKKLKRRTHV